MKSRPRVVHVSGDFPDPLESHKTAVIRQLVDLTADRFDHQVFSLNRRTPPVTSFVGKMFAAPANPGLDTATTDFNYGKAIEYQAPPRGIYHAAMLRQLGDFLAGAMRADPPDLIIGHKLTIEGIAVAHAAQALGVPYALSLQGDTDTKVLDFRRDLRPLFARIFHRAEMVFPFAPWTLAEVEQRLGKRDGVSMPLPCPTELDAPIAPRVGAGGLLSLFHLASQRRKNLDGMAHAARTLDSRGEGVELAVAGGGSEADFAACRRAIAGARGMRLIGPLGRSEVAQTLNRASGFILPSRRESFGLVFVEALFAGVPIVYPAGQAVSGYFDGAPFAIAVDPRDTTAIARAMRRLVEEEAALKSALAAWQGSAAARRFTRPAISETFSQGLETALRSGSRGRP
jgi:glycosyltransferase involved in cell wall biosynthesis